MSDAETTIQDLRAEVHRFNDDRDWQQFHTPKNVAASIAIEAAELLEHFQWADEPPPGRLPKLAEELADVVIYCLTLANASIAHLSRLLAPRPPGCALPICPTIAPRPRPW